MAHAWPPKALSALSKVSGEMISLTKSPGSEVWAGVRLGDPMEVGCVVGGRCSLPGASVEGTRE